LHGYSLLIGHPNFYFTHNFTMKKLIYLAAFIAACSIMSCQQRTVCSLKMKTGGISHARIYSGTYNTEEEYEAAVAAFKRVFGYTSVRPPKGTDYSSSSKFFRNKGLVLPGDICS
jgi:hypothetical protein